MIDESMPVGGNNAFDDLRWKYIQNIHTVVLKMA